MKKYYFQQINGHVIGKMEDFILKQGELLPDYIVEMELEEDSDIIESFIQYKSDGTKLSSDEYKALYPSKDSQPTQEERLTMVENAMQDFILMQMNGGE